MYNKYSGSFSQSWNYFLCLTKHTICTSTIFKWLDGPWPDNFMYCHNFHIVLSDGDFFFARSSMSCPWVISHMMTMSVNLIPPCHSDLFTFVNWPNHSLSINSRGPGCHLENKQRQYAPLPALPMPGGGCCAQYQTTVKIWIQCVREKACACNHSCTVDRPQITFKDIIQNSSIISCQWVQGIPLL